MGASEGHLSETDGDLTTNGWGRSDSDMAGEILDCMGAISAAPVPVIGPHRGSRITEKNRFWIGSKGKYSVNVSGAINNISVEKKYYGNLEKNACTYNISSHFKVIMSFEENCLFHIFFTIQDSRKQQKCENKNCAAILQNGGCKFSGIFRERLTVVHGRAEII